jgi:dipeptidyl aminopeptidase/acylaminoacyl peptidase
MQPDSAVGRGDAGRRRDATRWAVAQGIADAGRICIFGASYGGYSALAGAVRDRTCTSARSAMSAYMICA